MTVSGRTPGSALYLPQRGLPLIIHSQYSPQSLHLKCKSSRNVQYTNLLRHAFLNESKEKKSNLISSIELLSDLYVTGHHHYMIPLILAQILDPVGFSFFQHFPSDIKKKKNLSMLQLSINYYYNISVLEN